MKDDQDKLAGSPEKSWSRGGGGEWLLLELSFEVDLLDRDFRCLERPLSVFVCNGVLSVQFVVVPSVVVQSLLSVLSVVHLVLSFVFDQWLQR